MKIYWDCVADEQMKEILQDKWLRNEILLFFCRRYIETADGERESAIAQRKCNKIVNSPHPFLDSKWLHCSFGVNNLYIFPNAHPQNLNHKILFVME